MSDHANADPRCTCLSMREALREVGTRLACPVHPEPPWLADLIFLPPIPAGGPFATFDRPDA